MLIGSPFIFFFVEWMQPCLDEKEVRLYCCVLEIEAVICAQYSVRPYSDHQFLFKYV